MMCYSYVYVYTYSCYLSLNQILKREWPKNWTSFIPDIVGSSKNSEILCQNNMAILKLLSEEVFDFSSGQITQTKAKHLKDTMCSEFSQIFTLCQYVMEKSTNVTLVGVTLETLLRFLNWIPLGYIFETDLIPTLTMKVGTIQTYKVTMTGAMTVLCLIFNMFCGMFSTVLSCCSIP